MKNPNELAETNVYLQTPAKSNKTKNIIISLLTIALIAMGAFYMADKNKSGQTIEQQKTEIAQVVDEKSDIQKSFDESLVRLDSMSNLNVDLNNKLESRNKEITKAKTEIRSILNKKNATQAELTRAKELIASLNETITDMQQQVARLTQDNQVLTQEKTVLTEEKVKLTQDLTDVTLVKEELTKKVDVASTLNASDIAITPVNVKKNEKEKVTTTAKRVDKLLISFAVVNRIIQPGVTDVYVLVTGPDGKLVSAESLGSGTFTTRDEGDKQFTTKLPVDLETATKKKIEFAFAPGDFLQGKYTIQIYQNGYMIGEGVRELKKGGLFS